MKAVRLVKQGNPLEMHDVEIPLVGENDVLVKIKTAGICHSDAHYRNGVITIDTLPITLGHEISGVIEKTGSNVDDFKVNDRVCIHYMATCGSCSFCNSGNEQFCTTGKMIGKLLDGGYAEYISVPARSVFLLPEEIPFEQGAVMMCSTATSYHALKKARLEPSETVAIFGIGGLGISAIQLAFALGSGDVYAVDIKPTKLKMAEELGAIPINAAENDPVEEIKKFTKGGVNVSLELIGLPQTVQQSIKVLGVMGRAAIVGLSAKKFEVTPYSDLLGKEAEIIGISDHLMNEIPELIDLMKSGKLDLYGVVSKTIPLEADSINEVLDGFGKFSEDIRVVIVP